MKARVYVTLRRDVLDPQGEAVRRGLASLGHDEVSTVRVGKYIEIELGGDRAQAEKHCARPTLRRRQIINERS